MSNNAIIIIGSGLAGYNVARELRKLDQDSELIIIANDNADFYSKPMLSNALAKNKTAAELVMSDSKKMAEDLNATIHSNTQVMSIDRENKTVDTTQGKIEYRKLVLATGALANRLSFTGNATDKIVSVNDIYDYENFRKQLDGARHVVIIGSGLIGCEFANDMITSGFEVSVIGIEKKPLASMMPETAGEFMQQKLAEQGVNWYLDTSVNEINFDENFSLQLSDGSELTADVVLTATGLRPNTELAKQAGLEIQHGIAVNSHLETSDKDIYSLGDCAEVEGLWLPYVMPLMNAARALAQTLVGQTTKVNYPVMPVMVKTPACATVIAPPAKDQAGEWKVSVDESGVRAEFFDQENNLKGFALLGDHVSEKMNLSKQLPALLD